MAKRSTATSKSSPQQITAKEKALKALALRKDGWAFREIAENLGYSGESGARNAVNRLLAKTEFEAVADYRTLKLMQLDGLYKAVKEQLYDKDKKISLWAVDRLQAIIDQQSKLLGLYTLGELEAYDWRKEFEAAGLDGDELAAQLFEQAIKAYNDKQTGQ